MLKLVTLPPAFGMRNVSPFCLKIEMLMTALELPFDHAEESDPRKAPQGKLPFLVTEEKKIPDSEVIAVYLDELTGGKVFGHFTAEQLAQGYALTRLCEDHLYWIMVASRWLNDDWWPNVVCGFFGNLPQPLRYVASSMARREVRKTYNLQGLGRHPLTIQEVFARRDLQALDAAVPATGFLFNDTPDIFDFTVAGMMAGVYDNKPATWVGLIAEEFENLRAYTERVQSEIGIFGRELKG